jgi:hypothetical protein
VATFLATPSSANLATAVTDETGSGALVFGTSPSIATPTITGANYKVNSTTRREAWEIIGYKNSPSDDTFFDVLNFTAPGGAGSTSYRGVCSGILTITFHNRHTSGYVLARSRAYFVTVYCMYYSGAYVMQSDIQQLGSDNAYEGGGFTITATVQEKSGASSTALTIEAKFTHTAFGTAGHVMWAFQCHSVGSHAEVYITPATA